jgi:hypothetical protein
MEKTTESSNTIQNIEDQILPDGASQDSRYGACEICKKEGNEFFQQKNYKKAIECYEKVSSSKSSQR